MYKTSSYTFRLWGTTNLRCIQKHTFHKIILGIIPIEDLRQAVETAKRILMKEKIDIQLAGQSLCTPFMSTKESYNNKKVTFNTQDGLKDKIDRLMVMISKLAAKDDGINKKFKPQIYQSKRMGQSRNFYDKYNYDQRNYQNRYGSNSGDKGIQFSGRIQYGQNFKVDPDMGKTIGLTLEEEILG